MRLSTRWFLCAGIIGFAACGSSSAGDDAAPGGDDGAVGSDAASVIDARPYSDAAEAACTPRSGTAVGLELVASGLDRPLFVTSPPGDARLFIVEQWGRIWIVENGTRLTTPFLDISGSGLDRVRTVNNEQGLLGLAFHPNYAQNGRFFVNYSARSPSGATVIAEYTASGDGSLANTEEKRILIVDQDFGNHNGGMIDFGPDGYLWIGMGDGGSGNDPEDRAQDNTYMLGAMLRIDVDGGDPYAIPADNPYADSADGAGDPRPEIWADGLRNPWRWSFDLEGGLVYIADVGQSAREYIHAEPITAAGLNYGWPVMEGTRCNTQRPDMSVACNQPHFLLPIHAYSHPGPGGGCRSITGGYVYRGTCMPDLDGWYFFAEYCTGQVWRLRYDGEDVDVVEVTQQFSGATSITSFGVDATGEMYVISRPGNVHRIVLAD
jgi:glucose/arabinose dehydrogenase